MTNLNISYPTGNLSLDVDTKFVVRPPSSEFGPTEVFDGYSLNQVTWQLLYDRSTGNIVIPPGDPFSVIITNQSL